MCKYSERESLREKVLKESFSLFRDRGVVSVRMDDIASALSMSKRTLYEMFGNKEELVLECVKFHQNRNETMIEIGSNSDHDILNHSFEFMHIVMMEFNSASCCFFEDLKKYPKVLSYIEELHKEGFVNGRIWLEKGVEQGLFRKDVSMDVVVKTINAISRGFSYEMGKNRYELKTLFGSTIMVLMRGIATPKGLSILSMYEKFYFTNDEI